jgi:glycosyltransferase involved in cell wall biosynthesis
MNFVLLGGFPYPKGMAPTRHILNIVDGLRAYPEISIHVMVLRQSSGENVLSGVHEGIPYETVMGDALRVRGLLMAPLFHLKARRAMERVFEPGCRNVLYVYGPPSLDNVPALRRARGLGFKVIFEIVEDDDVALGVSGSAWHRLANAYIRRATRRIASLADGIVVISSRLEDKFLRLTGGAIPLHYKPVSVVMDRYPDAAWSPGDTITLFYSGSFGLKDGIPVLLDAFDGLAARHANVRLVLTGKGSAQDMAAARARIEGSLFRDRIFYRGYLDDSQYQAELNAADIPCMTRIDSPYANAGFPFKLGEFLATGRPVVASKVSDVTRWLRHEESAMLVEPGNASDVIRSVEFLLQHPDKAAAIGHRGRDVASRAFCHKRQAADLVAFAESLSKCPAVRWKAPARSVGREATV